MRPNLILSLLALALLVACGGAPPTGALQDGLMPSNGDGSGDLVAGGAACGGYQQPCCTGTSPNALPCTGSYLGRALVCHPSGVCVQCGSPFAACCTGDWCAGAGLPGYYCRHDETTPSEGICTYHRPL